MKKRLLLFLLLFLLPRLCWGAVTVSDSTAGACAQGTGNALSWSSHSVIGSDRYLVVAITIADAGDTITSVTLGVQNLEQIGEVDDTIYTHTELWGLVAPTLGVGTITVTADHEPAYDWCAHDFGLTGVDPDAPHGAAVTKLYDNSAHISVDVAGAANGLVIDVMGNQNPQASTPTADIGQTIIRQIANYSGGAGVNTSYKAGTGTLTMGWTYDYGEYAAQIGVLINPKAETTVVRHKPVIQ